MELKWKIHKKDYKPSDYTATETVSIMGVRRGTLVRQVALRIGVAFTPGKGETIDIGVGNDPDGFMTATEAALTAGLKNGAGEYLVTKDTAGITTSHNGKLYTEDDTIDLKYTGAGEVVAGQCTVIIVYCEIE